MANDASKSGRHDGPVSIQPPAHSGTAPVQSGTVPAPRSLAQIRPGTLIGEKYLVERVLGRGGMGVVLAAKHVEENKHIALKFLDVKSDEMPDDFQARFALEAHVCSQLKNRHIARVHETGIWLEQYPFMVMDYLEGKDLRKVAKVNAKFPLAQAIDYAVQICEGLAEAHAKGIVHRDLKPANIFITKQTDGTDLVKVLDFGISKWAAGGDEFSELTKAGTMLGSPKYMSPEQLAGSKVDARADIWSIGAILYGMLVGRPPYDHSNVTQTFIAIATGQAPTPASTLEPSVPAEMDALILKCIAKDRDARFQDVGELAAALLEIAGSTHAAQTRTYIAAVLDGSAQSIPPTRPLFVSEKPPVVVELPPDTSRSATTVRPKPATSSAAYAPLPPEPILVKPSRSSSTKSWWALAAAAVVIAAMTATQSPAPSPAPAIVRAQLPRREVTVKQLTPEPASSLAVAPESETDAQ